MRKIKGKSVVAVFLSVVMCVAALAGCATGPHPADVLPRLEAAYNSQDIYAIARVFEPAVADAAFGILGLFGLGDLMQILIPHVSMVLGATGVLDEWQWGTVRLTEISTEIDGNRALLTYEVHLTYADGRTATLTETIRTVLIDGEWYIAAIQWP